MWQSFHWTALVLTIIGAINWGLWGFFQFDLVAAIFDGQEGTISRIIYSIVGIAGVVLIFTSMAAYEQMSPERTTAGGTARRAT